MFICGPKSFETSLVAMLRECGVSDSQIFIEEFASVAPAPDAGPEA